MIDIKNMFLTNMSEIFFINLYNRNAQFKKMYIHSYLRFSEPTNWVVTENGAFFYFIFSTMKKYCFC